MLQKYVAKSGRIPFDEWIVGLSSVMRARVYANLARIEAGNLGNVKPIADAGGIMELRLFFGPGYRVYMGLDGETLSGAWGWADAAHRYCKVHCVLE